MMMRGMIEVTSVPLEKLIREAYNRSAPQGLGFMHFKEGELPEADVQRIIGTKSNSNSNTISMDYVNGRSCKFSVYKREGRSFIKNRWYDHSDSQLCDLLVAVGLSPTLINSARADEQAYENECVAGAITFLMENGGTFTETRGDTALSNDITFGLYVGKEMGLIKEDWNPNRTIWAIAPEKLTAGVK